MCHPPSKAHGKITLADIVRRHGEAFRERHPLPPEQHKALNAILNCRTAALGGHVDRCNACGGEVILYNSCRHRHCPTCQALSQARWLEARAAELLPVEYFHVVFTLPHELNPLVGYNPKLIYNLLFQAAWETIHTLGRDRKRLAGEMGMLAVLHTWSQRLMQHPHLHCIVPGGALDGKTWHACKKGFLFPVRVMSKYFRGCFVRLLRRAYEEHQLTLQGSAAQWVDPACFRTLLDQIMAKPWCVYCKRPFHGAKGAVAYLAKYVHKTAIANDRILSCENAVVSFKWRDSSNHHQSKTMALQVDEFLRRFLMHLLPSRFMRIRTFGFMANAQKGKRLPEILASLGQPDLEKKQKKRESTESLMQRITGIDITLCPYCKKGRLESVRTLPNMIRHPGRAYCDTS